MKNWQISLLSAFMLIACARNYEEPVYYELEDYYWEENIFTAPFKAPQEYDPNSLVGLSYGEIYESLGPADFSRPEGNKELVQYRGKDCIIDLFVEYWEGVPPRDPKDAKISKERRENSSITYVKLRDRKRDAAIPQSVLRQCLYLLMETRPKEYKAKLKQW